MLTVIGIVLGHVWLGEVVLPLLWLGWLLTTVLSGVRAMKGEPSDPLISKVVPIRLLRGDGPTRSLTR